MSAACRALGVPVVSGNVSLYNETDGEPIYPTPMVGALGKIERAEQRVGAAFREPGDAIVLLGDAEPWLGGSLYLAARHGTVAGRLPRLDLEDEARLQRLLVELAAAGLLRSAHDIADGGLAVAVAESAILGRQGVDVSIEAGPDRPEAELFGEGQSRALVSVAPERLPAVLAAAAAAGVPARRVGRVGGARVRFGDWIDLALDDVAEAWERGLELASSDLPS
jgi:phosphoribosylformylglycinamidine synthase